MDVINSIAVGKKASQLESYYAELARVAPPRSDPYLAQLNDEGTTIIQVTHNEEFAKYGKRIIRIVDGLIESDALLNK